MTKKKARTTMTPDPDWLAGYRDGIIDIESRRPQWLMDFRAREPEMFARLAEAMSGDVTDPQARDRLLVMLLEVVRPAVAEEERSRVRLLAHLEPVYSHLASGASQEEWDAYLDVVLRARARAVIGTSEWLRRETP